MPKALEILNKYWGFSNFRASQKAIINTVANGQDTFVLLPTGGGKSICYQIPAIMLDGICIVVTPLLALMYNQVKALQEKGIKAIALTSQLNFKQTITAFDNLQYGNFKFLYLSPEKLQSELIQEKIKNLNVSIIAIDEAHCISEWGHDFRPSYLNLSVLKKLHPKATLIALTATATPTVIKDIKKQLQIEKWTEFKSSFYRKNLSYQVIHTENIYLQLISLLKNTTNAVIVYTKTRRLTKEISNFLIKNNFKSSFYHGGLTTVEKQKALQSWQNNRTPIMVATNAFGMGIDKENVGLVVHTNIPLSIENYVQECGRAGRNGKYAKTVLISNPYEIENTKRLFLANLPDKQSVKKVYLKLVQYLQIAKGETPLQSFAFSLQKFCDSYKLPILKTYNTLKYIEKEGIISLDDNYQKKSTLKFKISSAELFNFIDNNPSEEKLIKLLLRSYGGIFDFLTHINETNLAKKLNTDTKTIINKLLGYKKLNLVNYSYQQNTTKLAFLVPREDTFIISNITKNIKSITTYKKNKFNSVLEYISNNKVCRSKQLLNYFNEPVKENCGTCDVCLSKIKYTTSSNKAIGSSIISFLKNSEKTTIELTALLNLPQNIVIKALQSLLENNKIKVTSQNKFKITTNE